SDRDNDAMLTYMDFLKVNIFKQPVDKFTLELY
ncbi:unnamed protein product, partial [marine sediment metagenome]